MLTAEKPTQKPKVEKKEHPLLTKREMRFLASSKNVVESPIEMEEVLSDDTLKLISENILQPGLVYTLISLRPDKHSHKILIQSLGNNYQLYFFDNNSSNNGEEYILKCGFSEKNKNITIRSFYTNNNELIAELEDKRTLNYFLNGLVNDLLNRDISVVLDQNNINNYSDIDKPLATKFIDPSGKNSRIWKKPRD